MKKLYAELLARLGVNTGTLEDGRNIAKDVTSIGHYGTGDYEIIVDTDNDIEYIMSLIKQVVNK